MLARSVLKVPAIGDATKKESMKVVKRESAVLCTKGSLLRATSAESLSKVQMEHACKRSRETSTNPHIHCSCYSRTPPQVPSQETR